MYKATQDNKDYLERVGSHSTKESRTGLIKMIPEWAQPAEEYYNDLKDQYKSLIKQNNDVLAKCASIKIQLLQKNLPPDVARRLAIAAKSHGDKSHILQGELRSFKSLVNAAANEAFGIVFREAAKRILEPDQFQKIDGEVRSILSRSPDDGIKVPKDDDQLEVMRAKRRRHEKRSKLNRARLIKEESGVVWSDEAGIKTEIASPFGVRITRNKSYQIVANKLRPKP